MDGLIALLAEDIDGALGASYPAQDGRFCEEPAADVSASEHAAGDFTRCDNPGMGLSERSSTWAFSLILRPPLVARCPGLTLMP